MTDYYIFKIDPPEDGNNKPLDLEEAREVYAHDPVGFAEWELRRAKSWANLIATDYAEVCRIDPPIFDYVTQDYRHDGAVNYIRVCELRLRHAKRKAMGKAASKKKTKVDGSMI